MVAVDRLLAEAVRCHWNESSDRTEKNEFVRLTDSDVIAMLKSSQSTEATEIIHTLLYEPSKINVSEKKGSGYPITIRKLYNREPLCKGEPLTHRSEEARTIIQSLSSFGFDLEVSIS
ncbi:hypothetical protein [Bacillus sp. JCM 19034]|uniref:hypothetical protein n=1 Tax=Bacillus sp. JCM 19034 TaxID=1481928 RepID=UPI000A5DA370|nr:hypothetical protein [Bacillus sp. JCM 19034]